MARRGGGIAGGGAERVRRQRWNAFCTSAVRFFSPVIVYLTATRFSATIRDEWQRNKNMAYMILCSAVADATNKKSKKPYPD